MSRLNLREDNQTLYLAVRFFFCRCCLKPFRMQPTMISFGPKLECYIYVFFIDMNSFTYQIYYRFYHASFQVLMLFLFAKSTPEMICFQKSERRVWNILVVHIIEGENNSKERKTFDIFPESKRLMIIP